MTYNSPNHQPFESSWERPADSPSERISEPDRSLDSKPQGGHGLGVASICLAALALVMIPAQPVGPAALAVVAVVLGWIGLRKRRDSKRIEVAGLIMSVVALGLSLGLSVFWFTSMMPEDSTLPAFIDFILGRS